MALPPGIAAKTVTLGIASFADGSLANGRATISLNVNVIHTPSNRPIFSSDMTKPFVDGIVTFDLLPTDAPGLNRRDFSYHLKVEVQGANVQPDPIDFLLPTAGPDVVDLDGLVTVPSSAGVPIAVSVVTSVNGQTGDVTVAGGGSTVDASASAKGVVQLAGDLGGTAAAPTVPGLASKVNSSTYTAGLATKVSFWQPGETVTASTVRVAPDGTTIVRNVNGTTGSTYDTTEASFWTSVGGSGGAGAAPATSVRGVRSMPPPSRVLSRFAVGHGATGGADDLTVKLYGDRSYKATSDGAGNNKTVALPSTPVLDWTGTYVRLAVMVDTPANLSQLQLWMDSITSAAWFATIATSGTAAQVFQPGVWTIITIPRANFAVSGTATPVWTTVSRPRLVFKDKGGSAPVTVWWSAIEHLPEQATVYPNGVFMLEADDGFAAHKTLLRPMLDALGVPCTYNPIIERITSGAAGVSVADLKDMQDKSGWQISAHATTQAFHDNTSATAAQAAVDFAAQKKWLHDNGFHAGADDYALCPAAGINVFAPGAMRDAVAAYWRSARMFNGFVETVVPGEPLSFRSLGFSGNTNAQLQANIDAAAGPGGVFSLSIHDVLAGSTNGTSAGLAAIAVNNLQTVIQYALGKGMVPRTRGDWLALR